MPAVKGGIGRDNGLYQRDKERQTGKARKSYRAVNALMT
jgi:hypothetical protein